MARLNQIEPNTIILKDIVLKDKNLNYLSIEDALSARDALYAYATSLGLMVVDGTVELGPQPIEDLEKAVFKIEGGYDYIEPYTPDKCVKEGCNNDLAKDRYNDYCKRCKAEYRKKKEHERLLTLSFKDKG